MALGMAAVVTPTHYGRDELGARSPIGRSLRSQQRGKSGSRSDRNRGARRSGRADLPSIRCAAECTFRRACRPPVIPLVPRSKPAFLNAYSVAMAVAAVGAVFAAAAALLWLTAEDCKAAPARSEADRCPRRQASSPATPTSRARSCAGRRSPVPPSSDRDASSASSRTTTVIRFRSSPSPGSFSACRNACSAAIRASMMVSERVSGVSSTRTWPLSGPSS